MIALGQIPAVVTNHIRPYWRWRWTGLALAGLVAGLGWVGVTLIPNRFEAMTRIYVETETLLKPLLQNIAIQADLQNQLEVLQRTLLNRSNIVHVAHAADLDLDVQSEFEKERLYNSILGRIGIKVEGRNLFTVTFSDPDPRLARKVVETLLNIFVETNLGLNRSGMETARNFIERQIADYEQKLKEADLRLADFKSRHADILSAAGTGFAARLDRSRDEQVAAKGRYADALAARDQLKADLVATPALIDVDIAPHIIINTGAEAPAMTAKARLAQAEAELERLESRYTAHHPDVLAAKRALAQAQAALARERDAQRGRTPETIIAFPTRSTSRSRSA